MIQKCKTVNEFINTNAEDYEKWEMVWYINKEFNIEFKAAETLYNVWRKEYLNSRIDPKDVKPIERKPLENIVIEYANKNSQGVTLDKLKFFILYKKLGVKNMKIITQRTGMTEKAVQNFYVKLHHSGYKVGALESFDFNKISI